MGRSLGAQFFARFSRLRRNRRVQNGVTVLLVLLAPVLVGLTWYVMGPLDRGFNTPALRSVILLDLVYVMVVAGAVLQRMVGILAARRAKSAGSRLHLRLTTAFAILALAPTVLVAIFSVLTINIGLESWFSQRVQRVLGSSLQAAQAYELEHREELTRDARAIADLLEAERNSTFFMDDGNTRQALGRYQAMIERGLSEAFVIDGTGEIRSRAPRSYEFDFEPPKASDFAAARQNGLAIIADWENNEYRALIPLENFVDRYFYATRTVDGAILALLDETQATVALYDQLERDRGRILFEFALLYLGFALILFLAAMWGAISFADRLSRPIGRLLTASQRVGGGDFEVRVIEEEGEDEIAQLGHHFNQMTARLKLQHVNLIENTRQIEARRRLFDSVLSSITSGVIGVGSDGRITFVNPSAGALLGLRDEDETQAIEVVVPEFAELFAELCEIQEAVQGQVNLIRNGRQETLLVQMAPRLTREGMLDGYVVAFDDVTELVSAQRMAAWGDVARRIAHEIKNPLTPIQLSAERIKRKFSQRLGEDAETLNQMTDVIVRQTNDLRRIVDEFSKFARMPEPDKRRVDILPVLRDAITLQGLAVPETRIVADLPDEPLSLSVDATMLSQALINLIKNAGEAIETRLATLGSDFAPEIRVSLKKTSTQAEISISDNGIGLPKDRARLFEPYVTTRDKGTGLGLPIVKKIIEEHGGSLTLLDADSFDESGHLGAKALIRLPLGLENGLTENEAR